MNYMKLSLIFSLLSSALFTQNARADWARVLTCDGGVAYLEAATWDRHQVQFVITDHNIVNYLANNSWLKPVPDTGNLVIGGFSASGINSKQDFTSIQQNSSDLGYVNIAKTERQGSGIYVSFYMQDLHSGYGNNFTYPGNWLFRNCY